MPWNGVSATSKACSHLLIMVITDGAGNVAAALFKSPLESLESRSRRRPGGKSPPVARNNHRRALGQNGNVATLIPRRRVVDDSIIIVVLAGADAGKLLFVCWAENSKWMKGNTDKF